MGGPLGLHITSADIGRMLLESDNESEAINFSKSSCSNALQTSYRGQKIPLT